MRTSPLIARNGDKIICPNGHVAGSLTRDIRARDTIGPRDMSIPESHIHSRQGHYCANSECKQPVTRYRNGRFSVLTANGWIGELG
jgi:hypothetical protein